MGLASQQRISNIKKMRRLGENRPSTRTRLEEAVATTAASNSNASEAGAALAPAAQTKICRACVDKNYKKGHIIECPNSKYFGKTEAQIRQLKLPKIKMGLKSKLGMVKMFGGWSSQPEPDNQKIDFRMSADVLCELVDSSQQAMSTKAPPAIEILARAFQKRFPILDKATNTPLGTPENTKKLQWYKSSFGDGLAVTIPHQDSSKRPSALYSAAAGCRITFLRWELLVKNLKCCYCSDGVLVRNQSSLTKRGTILPIFHLRKKLDWVVGMSYTCEQCSKPVSSWDAQLIHSLPLWIQRLFPVSPKWMRGQNPQFFVSKDLGALVEHSVVTNSSGEAAASHLRRCLSDLYVEDHEIYLEALAGSKMTGSNKPVLPFVTFMEWIGSIPIPSGEHLRAAYLEAKQSNCTPTGYSDKFRNNLELQSVGATTAVAIDHTFGTLKNFRVPNGSLKPHAVFTTGTDLGMLATALITPDTKMQSFAHGFEQCARRPNFGPSMIYADTYPHHQKFMHLLFGDTVVGRLGLFHYIQRIIKTLRKGHIDIYTAIQALQQCIYILDESNEFAVVQALRDGSMNGQCHTDADIEKLKKTKYWMANYGRFIRKIIYSAPLIREKLDAWFALFKRRIDSETGLNLFTKDTWDALLSAKQHAEHITDMIPYNQMYNEFPPPPGARHTCKTFQSMRPESNLELFHRILEHCANGGMNHMMAHIISMQGICEMNLKKRETHRFSMMSASERNQIHTAFKGIPFHFDESRLCVVNERAFAVGLPKPFPYAENLGVDNGERFLWEYFEAQQRREKNGTAPCRVNERCPCPLCQGNPMPLVCSKEEDQYFFDAADEFDDPDFEEAMGTMTLPAAASIPKTPPPISIILDMEEATSASRKHNLVDRSIPCNTKKARYDSAATQNAVVSPESDVPSVVSPQVAQLPVAGRIREPPYTSCSLVADQPCEPTFCCPVFFNYTVTNTSRRGRPPHSKDCIKRSTRTEVNLVE